MHKVLLMLSSISTDFVHFKNMYIFDAAQFRFRYFASPEEYVFSDFLRGKQTLRIAKKILEWDANWSCDLIIPMKYGCEFNCRIDIESGRPIIFHYSNGPMITKDTPLGDHQERVMKELTKLKLKQFIDG